MMKYSQYGFTIDGSGKLDYTGMSTGDTFLVAKVIDAKQELWVLHRHGTKFWSGRRDHYANPSCLLVSVIPHTVPGKFVYDDIDEIEVKRGGTTSGAAIQKLWDRALEIAGQPKRPIEYDPRYASHKGEKSSAAKARKDLKATLAAINKSYVDKGFRLDDFQRFWRKGPRYIYRFAGVNAMGMDLAVVFTIENSIFDASAQATCHLRKIKEEDKKSVDFYESSMEVKRIDVSDLTEAQAWAEKLLTEFPFTMDPADRGVPSDE